MLVNDNTTANCRKIRALVAEAGRTTADAFGFNDELPYRACRAAGHRSRIVEWIGQAAHRGDRSTPIDILRKLSSVQSSAGQGDRRAYHRLSACFASKAVRSY